MEVMKIDFLKLFWSYVFSIFTLPKNSLQTWLKAVQPLQRNWAGIPLQAQMSGFTASSPNSAGFPLQVKVVQGSVQNF